MRAGVLVPSVRASPGSNLGGGSAAYVEMAIETNAARTMKVFERMKASSIFRDPMRSAIPHGNPYPWIDVIFEGRTRATVSHSFAGGGYAERCGMSRYKG